MQLLGYLGLVLGNLAVGLAFVVGDLGLLHLHCLGEF